MSADPLLNEARAEIDRLKVLVEASKLINSALEPRALFESILSVVGKELGVERGTLYFVDEAKKEIWAKLPPEHGLDEIRLPIGQGLAGWVAATGEEIVLEDAHLDPRFDSSLDKRSGYRTQSMICVPIRNRTRKIVGVLQLLNKKEPPFGSRDLDFLLSVSEHMAIAMENTSLHMALVVKDRMERELRLGREIQSRLLPPVPTDVEGAELAAVCRPCYEVGGDYYDFIPLPTGELGLAVGDVAGKGASAAMIMSSVKAALRVAAPLAGGLVGLVQRINELLMELAHGRKHVTLFFACYAPATGTLRYVNAGHHPGLVRGPDSWELLEATGMPVGLMDDAVYEEKTSRLAPGGALLLYTDGLTEAVNANDEEFGIERLQDAALDALERPLPELPEAVMGAVSRFQDGAPDMDDKTLLVLRRRVTLPS